MRLHAIVEDLAAARAAVEGGATVVQLRRKDATTDELVEAGAGFGELPATFVVNDDVEAAVRLGADGVHLGQSDLPLEAARRIAPRLAFGISTHDLDQVRRAVAQRPDYIAYGPVFATTTKQNPDPVQGLDALRSAVLAAGSIPVVAIGGISPAHAPEIYTTGAAALCAISAVNSAADVAAAARAAGRRPS